MRDLSPPVSYSLSTGDQSGWGVKLTTHLHRVPRLRKGGAIPLLSLYAFNAPVTFVVYLDVTQCGDPHSVCHLFMDIEP